MGRSRENLKYLGDLLSWIRREPRIGRDVKNILLIISGDKFRHLSQWKMNNGETWEEFLVDFRLRLWDAVLSDNEDDLAKAISDEIAKTRERLIRNGLIK